MINVVAAIIRDENNKIFIVQRNLKKAQGGLWEFPGGKIEQGETEEEALVREIKEEMNMDIEVISKFDEHIHEYPEKQIKLIAFNCKKTSESYELLEHEADAWISEEEFDEYEFAPADVYFVDNLKNTKGLK